MFISIVKNYARDMSELLSLTRIIHISISIIVILLK